MSGSSLRVTAILVATSLLACAVDDADVDPPVESTSQEVAKYPFDYGMWSFRSVLWRRPGWVQPHYYMPGFGQVPTQPAELTVPTSWVAEGLAGNKILLQDTSAESPNAHLIFLDRHGRETSRRSYGLLSTNPPLRNFMKPTQKVRSIALEDFTRCDAPYESNAYILFDSAKDSELEVWLVDELGNEIWRRTIDRPGPGYTAVHFGRSVATGAERVLWQSPSSLPGYARMDDVVWDGFSYRSVNSYVYDLTALTGLKVAAVAAKGFTPLPLRDSQGRYYNRDILMLQNRSTGAAVLFQLNADMTVAGLHARLDHAPTGPDGWDAEAVSGDGLDVCQIAL